MKAIYSIAVAGGLICLLAVQSMAIERPNQTTKEKKFAERPSGGLWDKPQEERSITPQKKSRAVPDETERPLRRSFEKLDKVPFIGVGGRRAGIDLLAHFSVDAGILVTEITPGGSAEKAGLKVNDLLLGLDREELGSMVDLKKLVASRKAGEVLQVELIRKGEKLQLDIEVGEIEVPQLRRNQRPGAVVGPRELEELMKELMADRRGLLNRNPLFNDPFFNRGFQGLRLELDGSDLGALQSNSSRTMFDGQGSMSLVEKDGKKELKLMDQNGETLFEGPYNSEEDKAALPERYRERVENFLSGIGGAGLKFELDGNSYRPSQPKGD